MSECVGEHKEMKASMENLERKLDRLVQAVSDMKADVVAQSVQLAVLAEQKEILKQHEDRIVGCEQSMTYMKGAWKAVALLGSVFGVAASIMVTLAVKYM